MSYGHMECHRYFKLAYITLCIAFLKKLKKILFCLINRISSALYSCRLHFLLIALLRRYTTTQRNINCVEQVKLEKLFDEFHLEECTYEINQ